MKKFAIEWALPGICMCAVYVAAWREGRRQGRREGYALGELETWRKIAQYTLNLWEGKAPPTVKPKIDN